jgi:hypothetical protein
MLLQGDVQIIHFVPGRVRLKAKSLRGTPNLARDMEAAFKRVPGVYDVEASSLSGNILVNYDPHALLSDDATNMLSVVLRTYFPGINLPMVLSWLREPSRDQNSLNLIK